MKMAMLAPMIAVALLACPAAAKEGESPAVPVSVAAASRQDVPVLIEAIGTVVPRQSVAVRPRIDSQIIEVKFRDGDEVKKGNVLFLLDDRILNTQMSQAQAALDRDKAQLENLQRSYERNEKLMKQAAISRQVFEDAEAALAAQAATVAADGAALDNIKAQMDYSIITAPIDGRTGTINVTAGNIIKANDETLVTINQIKPVLVQASLPQDDFDKVRTAMSAGPVPAALSRSGDGRTVQGFLEYIDNAINQDTGTFITRAVFANEDESLWPGMLTNLAITAAIDKQALVIPEVAVQNSAQGDFVFVIAEGKAQKRPVKVARMEKGLAIIVSGLQDGEQIAIDGMMALSDGTPVSISSGQNPKTP